MSSAASTGVQAVLHRGDRATWTTAALVLTLDDKGSPELRRAARDLLAASEVGDDDLAGVDGPGIAAQAAAPVHQVASLLRGDGQLWAAQSDEALLAQGRGSAQGAALMAQFLLPQLDGLADAFVRPGVRMLDVGTGVAALAVAWAERFPALTVVGLDVLPRVLALAATTVASSGARDRVELRCQDVSELDDIDTYAFGWLPAPFLPEAALHAGARTVSAALVPGGWLMLGHGRFAEDPIGDAVTRFKTVAFGGTPLDDATAQALLRDVGLDDIATLATPPGSPAITVGRRPA